jgi:RND superfamily putative drug exporter
VRRWGYIVQRCRWWVLGSAVVLLVLSVLGLSNGGQLKNASDYDVESVHAADLERDQLPATDSFDLILTSRSLSYPDPALHSAVSSALSTLRSDKRVTGIQTAYDLPQMASDSFVSTDRHSILAVVGLNIDFATARQQFGELRDEVHDGALSVSTHGDVPLAHDYDTLLGDDLRRAEFISLPLALILLLVVFGTGIAALLCLGVGMFAVAGGVGASLMLARGVDVSTYAENVVTLIGLGVAIDYSLFIVTRFREQLAKNANVAEALAVTMATAGRAILFSGLTVAIGLAGLFFYTGTPLVSMGVSGAIVVAISVLYALTLLPALLAILGPRVNRLRVPILQPRPFGRGTWHRLATWVMRRPWRVLLPTVALLVLVASPFLDIHLANSDVTQLPVGAESRQGADLLQAQFPQAGQNTVDVVMRMSSGSPTAAGNVAAAYMLSRRLRALPGVVGMRSYVDVDPSLSLTDYQQIYAQPRDRLPADARMLADGLTGASIAVLQVQTPYRPQSGQAESLVRTLRSTDTVAGASTQVTGDTAFSIDFVDYMLGKTPPALAFVVITTFAVLLLLLRSMALPVKAVLMNVLSLGAAFGALVWVFQQGHLASLLAFTPGPLDPTIPVLLFCIVFGLSMDYEVFLLTRMQEAYRQSNDNRRAVADGLEHSGRLVTGAAAIMACVFLGFALGSSITLIKSIGFGMAVAVIVDASLVRALVVPAAMRLLGRVNWWAPRFMRFRSSAEESAPAA